MVMGYRRDNLRSKLCKDWTQFIIIIIIIINLTTTIYNPTRKMLPLMTLYVYKPYAQHSHTAQVCNSMKYNRRYVTLKYISLNV
jgi:hypothetical protein